MIAATTERVRHVGRVEVAGQILLDSLLAPEGTEVVGAAWNPDRGTLDLYVTHPEIAPVLEGQASRQLFPIFTTNHRDCGHDDITASWLPGTED